MSGDKETGRIDTGGGAFVGGSVDTGGGPFIGRDHVTTTISRQGITLEEFGTLLAEMRGLIPQAGLEERKAQDIEAEVVKVEEEAQAAQPDRSVVVGKLEYITKILKAAGNLTDEGKKLLPLAAKALEWGSLLLP